ncbi:hypothetical protein [uncultured Duncaniella sp.]|uniref:hypothetical protein n=1 Tax=uncultured Duncaniella sp. TaxID=2768039 RepID=UPI0025A50E6F|nr:hypothetical protein [uncultured Duncaniella sp.]
MNNSESDNIFDNEPIECVYGPPSDWYDDEDPDDYEDPDTVPEPQKPFDREPIGCVYGPPPNWFHAKEPLMPKESLISRLIKFFKRKK